MSEKKRITYLLIKLVIFTILAALVLIFRDSHVAHLKPFIGALMLLYGIEELLFEILNHHGHFIHEPKTYLSFVEIIFGVILFVVDLQFEYVCIIWATWSIIRESYEIKEIVADMKSITPRILSGVESVVAIIFSVMLIMEPGEHHATIHMILLVAELILAPLVVLLDELIVGYKEKKKLTKNPEE